MTHSMNLHASVPGQQALVFLRAQVRTFLLASAFILSATQAHAQGCVIARGGGGAMISDGSGFLEPKQWQMSFAFRWFKSDRHYVGPWEQPQRQAQGTEVINDSYFYDVTATYAWTKRLNLSMTIPFVYHDRSSLYEHLGNSSGQRFHTQSAGLADMRVAASYWLIDPDKHSRWNLSVGVGLKLPTGEDEARDIFIRSTGPTERYVDSSIQPGDGGLGATLELQGFFVIREGMSLYGSAFYLFNPEERSAVTNFSKPDSYLARGGLEYVLPVLKGVSVSLGGRIEGVPGHDAYGGNKGSRRPGFSVAVEPGVTFTKGKFSGTLTVPIAVHRNRTTTFGSTRAGDAAFADFSINSALTYRF